MVIPPFHAAWLVDLDGTLYRAAPLKALMAAELITSGWGAVSVLRAFRRQHEHLRHHPQDCAGDPFVTQLRRTAQQLNVSQQEVAGVVQRWMFERPGKWLGLCARRSLLTAIAAHRSSGGRTALVSDYPAQVKLRALGADHLFDAVVAAGEPGGPAYLKPSPAGYRLAAQALGVSTGDCLVLGDRLDADGAAAGAAGMAFHLVR